MFSGALKASSGFLAKTSIVEGERCGDSDAAALLHFRGKKTKVFPRS